MKYRCVNRSQDETRFISRRRRKRGILKNEQNRQRREATIFLHSVQSHDVKVFFFAPNQTEEEKEVRRKAATGQT